METNRVVLAAVVAAALVGLAWLALRWYRTRYVGLAAAKPPARALTTVDKIVARLVNAVDYDLRSLELARWFVEQLAAADPDCTDLADLDRATRHVANKLPGLNDVTRAELQHHLQDLAERACADAGPGGRAAYALRSYEPVVVAVLKGMPGYPQKSRRPLPP